MTLAEHDSSDLIWDDLYLFYGKVKFCNMCFYTGQCNDDKNFCSMWPGNWLIYSKLNE